MRPIWKGRRSLPIFLREVVFFSFFSSVALGAIDPDRDLESAPIIRVLLQKKSSQLQISGWDVQVSGKKESESFRYKYSGRKTLKLSCRRGLVFLQDELRRTRASSVRLSSSATTLLWGSRVIREDLVVHASPRGCLVVNHLDFEKYLNGVVNGEFSSKWSPQAVAAQVIAARSYALYQLQSARKTNALFDVDSTTQDQVYIGTESEDSVASQVVAKTRGLILTASSVSKPSPIKAFYHSTCAGLTGSPVEVWGKPQVGVQGGIRCYHCSSSPRYRWQLQASSSDLQKALASQVDGRVSRIEVLSYFDSGRVKEVKIESDFGKNQKKVIRMSAARFRFLLGSDQLKSTFFSISGSSQGEWLFEGRGFGHGVGMCQWGAKEMGAVGYSYQEILARYYPLARIARVW